MHTVTSRSESRARGYVLVALAACMWGTLGLFFRGLHDTFGFPALTVAFLRAGVAALLLAPAMVVVRSSRLFVSLRSIGLFLIYGLVGVAAFYFFYVQAVIQTSVTTAVVLLYTAPFFVTLVAWRVWQEPLTPRKVAALAIAFSGCALVARAYDPSEFRVNGVGLIMGLGAGLTYALYTILSKIALREHSNGTALTYALVFGTLFLLPLQSPASLSPLVSSPLAWLVLLGLALGPTLGSLTLYNLGLRDVPASNASLIAMLEPVVASVLAFVFLGERMEFLQSVGGVMVIMGALLVR